MKVCFGFVAHINKVQYGIDFKISGKMKGKSILVERLSLSAK